MSDLDVFGYNSFEPSTLGCSAVSYLHFITFIDLMWTFSMCRSDVSWWFRLYFWFTFKFRKRSDTILRLINNLVDRQPNVFGSIIEWIIVSMELNSLIPTLSFPPAIKTNLNESLFSLPKLKAPRFNAPK